MTQTDDTVPSYATIVATGADATEFLQGQLTADITTLVDRATPALSAWCNPKGRVIALFRVRPTDDGYRLALPADIADTVVKRLTMFRFRSKVEFATVDADADDLGRDTGEDVSTWFRRQFEAGVAHVGTGQSEAFTPHMLNLDLLGAVSFDKGCYTGQEIVARTHYRGATKRRMLRFALDGAAADGDKVTADDRAVGDVVNVLGGEILAVVPTDAAAAGLTVNGQPLSLLGLPYLDA